MKIVRVHIHLFQLDDQWQPIQTDILSELEQTQKDVEGVGVGDIIAKVTKATGLDKVVAKFVKKTGIDCRCEDRKKRWKRNRK